MGEREHFLSSLGRFAQKATPSGLRKLFGSSTFWMGVLSVGASATIGIPLVEALWLFSGYSLKEGCAKIGDGLASRKESW